MKLPLTLFLDTNVIVDAFIPRERFSREAGLLFFMAECEDARLHWSTSMVTDLFYIAKRGTGQDGHAIQRKMADLMFGPNARNIFLHTLSDDDVRDALARSWPDFEDCIVSVCAESVGADYIVTKDARGFERSLVPAISPSELLEKVKREAGITYDEIEW